MEPPETQPEPESEPGWLPEELWLSIFDQLDAITMAKTSLSTKEFYDKTWRKYVRTVTLAGPTGMQPLLRQLRRTMAVEHLFLQQVAELSDDDLVFFSTMTSLSSLSIVSCSGISDEGFSHLAALSGLTELQIGSMPQISEKSFVNFTSLSRLATLVCFQMPAMNDAAMSNLLSQTSSLTALLLQNCEQVSSAPLHHLTRMVHCKGLAISGMDRVRPEIWQYIGGMTNLQDLTLSCGLADDNVVPYLGNLTSLNMLNLSWNNLSDDTLTCVTALTNLELLDLSHSPSWSGALFDMLQPLPSVKSFLLSVGEQFGVADVAGMARAFPNLDYLSLVDSVNDHWCIAIATLLPNLNHLFLEDTDAITDTGLQALSTLVHLKSFSVSGMEITERGLSTALRAMPELEYLDLHACHMLDDDAICVSLAPLSNLTQLYLTGNTGLTDGVLRVLRDLTALETLSLSNCPNMTNKAIRDACSLAPQLAYLDVTHCKGITNDCVKYLESMNNLQYFYAEGTKVTHSALRRKLRHLEEYSASQDPQRRCVIC